MSVLATSMDADEWEEFQRKLEQATSIEEVLTLSDSGQPSETQLIAQMGNLHPRKSINSYLDASVFKPNVWQLRLFSTFVSFGNFVERGEYALSLIHKDHYKHLAIASLSFSPLDYDLIEVETIKSKQAYKRNLLPFKAERLLPRRWEVGLVNSFAHLAYDLCYNQMRIIPPWELPRYENPAGIEKGTLEHQQHKQRMERRYLDTGKVFGCVPENDFTVPLESIIHPA